jgi:hypothetical protein
VACGPCRVWGIIVAGGRWCRRRHRFRDVAASPVCVEAAERCPPRRWRSPSPATGSASPTGPDASSHGHIEPPQTHGCGKSLVAALPRAGRPPSADPLLIPQRRSTKGTACPAMLSRRQFTHVVSAGLELRVDPDVITTWLSSSAIRARALTAPDPSPSEKEPVGSLPVRLRGGVTGGRAVQPCQRHLPRCRRRAGSYGPSVSFRQTSPSEAAGCGGC